MCSIEEFFVQGALDPTYNVNVSLSNVSPPPPPPPNPIDVFRSQYETKIELDRRLQNEQIERERIRKITDNNICPSMSHSLYVDRLYSFDEYRPEMMHNIKYNPNDRYYCIETGSIRRGLESRDNRDVHTHAYVYKTKDAQNNMLHTKVFYCPKDNIGYKGFCISKNIVDYQTELNTCLSAPLNEQKDLCNGYDPLAIVDLFDQYEMNPLTNKHPPSYEKNNSLLDYGEPMYGQRMYCPLEKPVYIGQTPFTNAKCVKVNAFGLDFKRACDFNPNSKICTPSPNKFNTK